MGLRPPPPSRPKLAKFPGIGNSERTRLPTKRAPPRARVGRAADAQDYFARHSGLDARGRALSRRSLARARKAGDIQPSASQVFSPRNQTESKRRVFAHFVAIVRHDLPHGRAREAQPEDRSLGLLTIWARRICTSLERVFRFRVSPLVVRDVVVGCNEVLFDWRDLDRRWRSALGIIFSAGIVIDDPEEVVV